MAKTETLEDFYLYKFNWMPDNLKKDIGHFNVFRVEDCYTPGIPAPQYSRRSFYKIALMRGKHLYHYADKSLAIDGSTLLFFNPLTPYTFEPLVKKPTGHFCIFREAFFADHTRAGIHELPIFAPGSKPAYELTKAQDKAISAIFTKMHAEMGADYVYKYDLIRNYVTEIIHCALKMQPAENLYRQMDANARITGVFTELLERQFPIETVSQRFLLRSAGDFAAQLAVHVNHLNRAIRLTTGKTTTSLIAERLASEAKALLKHTNWNIAEIGYSLGFDDPAHFNHFFKKQTSSTPSAFRQ